MQYTVSPVRRYSDSLISLKIVYVDFRVIGIHEQCKADRALEEERSMLEAGYHGPAISVFQVGSDEIYKNIKLDQQLSLEYGEIGVADGHHRLAAITQLSQKGLLKSPVIPVQLIPAHDTDVVRCTILPLVDGEAILANEKPMLVEAVEAYFKNPHETIPVDYTTRFQARLKSGEWMWIRESQPDIIIGVEDLISQTARQNKAMVS